MLATAAIAIGIDGTVVGNGCEGIGKVSVGSGGDELCVGCVGCVKDESVEVGDNVS
jgi:hypothetical protein